MADAAVAVVHELVEHVWNGQQPEALDRLSASPFDHQGREDDPDGLRRWPVADQEIWADTRDTVLDTISDGR